jgi:hypothetical protein
VFDDNYEFISTYYEIVDINVNFLDAQGLTTDLMGNLYFARLNNQEISKIDKATKNNCNNITVAGNGFVGYNGEV